METRALLVLLTALCTVACGDAAADGVCEKLNGCNTFYFKSMDDCVDTIEEQTESKKEECIACMDLPQTDCMTINEDDACSMECSFLL